MSFSPPPRTESDSIVAVITSADGKSFGNPRKVTTAIEQSNIANLIIPGETRVLGLGKGLLVKINKKNVQAFEKLDTLGEFKVKCKIPESQEKNVTYGFVGPLDPGVDEAEIQSDMTPLYSSSKVLQVVKVNTNKVRSFLRIKFNGPLPPKVAVGRLVFNTTEYKWPIKRCGKCHMFGHGTLTCRNSDVCSNCSGPHKQGDGLPCKKQPFCYLCGEKHKITFKSCPKALRASEIRNDNSLGEKEKADLLFKLNPTANTIRKEQPKTFISKTIGSQSFAQIALKNRYQSLQVEDTENLSNDVIYDEESRYLS